MRNRERKTLFVTKIKWSALIRCYSALRTPHSALVLCFVAATCLLSTVYCLLSAPEFASSWTPASALKQHILQKYPWPRVDVTEARMRAPLPDEAPVAVLIGKNPPGRTEFTLLFRSGLRIAGSAKVRAFDRVVMSRGAFGKGYALQTDDLYPVLMDVGRIPRGAIREPEAIAGKTLLRSIVPNAPITDAMIPLTPVMKRGDKVALVAGNDGFTVMTAGELKHDAAVGESVKVINLASKKIVAGLLVEEGTVRVEY